MVFNLPDWTHTNQPANLSGVKRSIRGFAFADDAVEFYTLESSTFDAVTEQFSTPSGSFFTISGVVTFPDVTEQFMGEDGRLQAGDLQFTTIYEHIVSGTTVDYSKSQYIRWNDEIYEKVKREIDELYGENVLITLTFKRKPNGLEGVTDV